MGILRGANPETRSKTDEETPRKESAILVLSRKRNQQIVIGEGESQIVVTVVEIRGDKVRLAVDAPKEIPVHRREVYEAIKKG